MNELKLVRVTTFQPDRFVLSTIYFSNLTFRFPVTKGSEALNLKNKLSKERIDLVEISLHSTYEECLLYLTNNYVNK